MISTQIIEGNKLIAEFMKIKQEQVWFNYPRIYPFVTDDKTRNNRERRILFDELKYHTSWDWLMPVVEKIENMDCVASLSIDFHNCCIFKRNDGTRIDQISNQTNDKITAVYKTVVDFINWFNQDKELSKRELVENSNNK